MLQQLRATRALLTVHADNHTPEDEPPASYLAAVIQDALPQVQRRYSNGRAMAANPAEEQAFDAFLEAERQRPSSVAALREWVLQDPNQSP